MNALQPLFGFFWWLAQAPHTKAAACNSTRSYPRNLARTFLLSQYSLHSEEVCNEMRGRNPSDAVSRIM